MGKDVHFKGKAKRNSIRPSHDEGVVKKIKSIRQQW